jgi:hypothetical protein
MTLEQKMNLLNLSFAIVEKRLGELNLNEKEKEETQTAMKLIHTYTQVGFSFEASLQTSKKNKRIKKQKK